MERGSRRSFQIQSKDDITEEAKVIRLRTSGWQYPLDDCRLPRYVKVDTESTGFPYKLFYYYYYYYLQLVLNTILYE